MRAEAEAPRDEPRAERASRQPSRLRLILRAMRVHQWVKNLLVFVPTLLAYRFLDPEPVVASALAFLSLSLGASAVYLVNDWFDVEADRRHPRKRLRPFASGDLPLGAGAVLIPLLLAVSFGLAWMLPREFLAVLLVYFTVTTLYSLLLKEIVLIDILVLAGLFTMRIIGGSAASGVRVSEWLLAFSMFLFLSLAAAKRYAELLQLRSKDNGARDARIARRGYVAGDTELVLQMGLSAGYIAVLVLALYITSDSVAALYHRPAGLWFVCLLLLFWVSRVWLLAHRGVMQDDPLDFAVRDGVTWLVALLGAAVLLVAQGSIFR